MGARMIGTSMPRTSHNGVLSMTGSPWGPRAILRAGYHKSVCYRRDVQLTSGIHRVGFAMSARSLFIRQQHTFSE